MAINGSDLRQRIMFGSIYVAITALCTLASWYATAVMIAVTAAICCYEFLRMARTAGYHPYMIIGTTAAALIPLALTVMAELNHAAAAGLFVAILAAIFMLLRYFSRIEDTIVDVALTLFGYLYTGFVLSSFILLRGFLPGIEGGVLCLLVLASICANDGLAYLGGSAFGKHKFAPHISPKKSWEGVACGIAASIFCWMLIPVLVPECGFGFAWAAVSGIVVGIADIIGDLTESHIKRGFGVKDAGDLLPGHGGLLDRSDSFIFGSVAAFAMVNGGSYLFSLLGVML